MTAQTFKEMSLIQLNPYADYNFEVYYSPFLFLLLNFFNFSLQDFQTEVLRLTFPLQRR